MLKKLLFAGGMAYLWRKFRGSGSRGMSPSYSRLGRRGGW